MGWWRTPITQRRYRGITVEEHEKARHRSKNYFKTINVFKNNPPKRCSVNEALDFFLDSDLIPLPERQSIQWAAIFDEDNIIVLHCIWAPTIDNIKHIIYQKIGWYPYVVGTFLHESSVSQNTDEWLEDRNFNALDFPNFIVQEIKLRDVSIGNGTALMLYFNDFKILLDCCFSLEKPDICNLQETPDVIFISHAHFDHYASFTSLISQMSDIPLIMSHTTLDLISYFQDTSPSIRDYLEKNAYALVFEDIYAINDDITLQILKAGHFPGAAMLYIFTPRHKILYTGDSCLYDLHPIKGSYSGLQNLNGPLDSLILDGRFCNEEFPSQKLLLDKACEQAIMTLQHGEPVLVLGDPGSWLLIFYLKFFFYLSQLNEKYRIFLDTHTIEIMEILRYRQEDITATLSQRILRFHDPFASIMRQDFIRLKLNQRIADNPVIILYSSKEYRNPPPVIIERVLENPNALLILTGPLRTDALNRLWKRRKYIDQWNSLQLVQCKIFGREESLKYPGFCLHIDSPQIFEIFRLLEPPQVYLFHHTAKYLTQFQSSLKDQLSKLLSKAQIQVNSLQPESEFILYHPFKNIKTNHEIPDTQYRFLPLIQILEAFLEAGINIVDNSQFAQKLNKKYPYWKNQLGFSKLVDYLNAAFSIGLIELKRQGSRIFIKLKTS